MESKSLSRKKENPGRNSASSKDKKLSAKKGMLLVAIATIFTAAGLIVFKLGAENFSFSFSTLINYSFIAGVILYLAGAAFLIIGLKYGALSTLYPFISLSYVWTFILSIFFLNETAGPLKITGCLLIIIGVSLLGIKGGNK